ncbi:MAG: hypothetical protein WCF53_04600, partial [Pseudolabrys sp.]
IQHPAEDHPILRLSPTAWNLRQGQGLHHRQISGGEIGCLFALTSIWLEHDLAMEVTHELPHSRP